MNVTVQERYVVAEWRDPADDRPDSRKYQKRVKGIRAYSVIDSLRARTPKEITSDHMEAVHKFQNDYARGVEGVSTINRASLDRVDNSASPYGPSQEQLDAMQRYREALHSLGYRNSSVVVLIVLLNWSVGEVAKHHRIRDDLAKGKLISALDRLHDHYNEGKQDQFPVMPDSGSYRLGRWKKP